MSQYAEMKKKLDAMAQELKSAKDDLKGALEQQAKVGNLKDQLSEMSENRKHASSTYLPKNFEKAKRFLCREFYY